MSRLQELSWKQATWWTSSGGSDNGREMSSPLLRIEYAWGKDGRGPQAGGTAGL